MPVYSICGWELPIERATRNQSRATQLTETEKRKMEFKLYYGDTFTTLSGDAFTKEEWAKWQDASSNESRKPASYAVHCAIKDATRVAFQVAKEQGLELAAYVSNPAIQDDGRIATAVEAIREAVAARAAKLAGQQPTHRCKGAKDGCSARVSTPNTYCARCAHDEE